MEKEKEKENLERKKQWKKRYQNFYLTNISVFFFLRVKSLKYYEKKKKKNVKEKKKEKKNKNIIKQKKKKTKKLRKAQTVNEKNIIRIFH